MCYSMMEFPGPSMIQTYLERLDPGQLAYQFGHGLGHVLSNSWCPNCAPHTPSNWIEELCVEAFSLRSLFELSPYFGVSQNISAYRKTHRV